MSKLHIQQDCRLGEEYKKYNETYLQTPEVEEVINAFRVSDALKEITEQTKHFIDLGHSHDLQFNYKAAFFVPNYCDRFRF